MAARSKRSQGVSPVGKIAILVILFGIPILFGVSSWGLSRLFEIAPYAVVAILIVVSTIYTAYTVSLMYRFYRVDPPILRFIPCVCELALVDIKYYTPCFVLYGGAILFFALSQAPYDILKIFGTSFALSAGFYMMLIAVAFLAAIQVVKGIALTNCLRDIEDEWKKVTHTDLGMIDKFVVFGYIPFVRVIAIYSLNKPLSTMVDFINVDVESAESANSDFYEEG